jgi:hypothetical protein
MTASDSNDDVVNNSLADDFQNRLEIAEGDGSPHTSSGIRPALPILICDAGYGVPREKRPRQEKILAIARQLANFLIWQQVQEKDYYAAIKVVACQDESLKQALEERTRSLLGDGTSDAPSPPILAIQHLSFSCQSLEETCRELSEETGDPVIYLSPDVSEALDPTMRPPRYVVIGLLIDRRIQPHRSQVRATDLNLISKRWPLDNCFREISAYEPLNVDCILEGMQQWWWNSDDVVVASKNDEPSVHRETFLQAAAQAIQHHAERHPSRPVHKRT